MRARCVAAARILQSASRQGQAQAIIQRKQTVKASSSNNKSKTKGKKSSNKSKSKSSSKKRKSKKGKSKKIKAGADSDEEDAVMTDASETKQHSSSSFSADSSSNSGNESNESKQEKKSSSNFDDVTVSCASCGASALTSVFASRKAVLDDGFQVCLCFISVIIMFIELCSLVLQYFIKKMVASGVMRSCPKCGFYTMKGAFLSFIASIFSCSHFLMGSLT
jgi:hypothetical protein